MTNFVRKPVQTATTSRRISQLSALVFVFLLTGCPTSEQQTGTEQVDSGDLGVDSTADVSPDTTPTRCENAPTARLTAFLDPEQAPPPAQRQTIEVAPLSYVGVNPEGSITQEGRSLDRFKWEIEERPEFTLATFGYKRLRRSYERPLFIRSTRKAPLMQIGLAGDYTISLTVWNDQGTISCNSAELTVKVRPDSELYVEYKYPYEPVESDEYPGQYLYQHTVDSPYLDFAFKRTADARWRDDLHDVIPNSRGETDVQDWGAQSDDSDDPVWTDVSLEGASNGFVELDGVESNTPYFAAVTMSRTPPDQTPAIFQVYIDGKRQFHSRRTLGEHQKAPFGMEVLKIEKSDDSYDIRPLSRVYSN